MAWVLGGCAHAPQPPSEADLALQRVEKEPGNGEGYLTLARLALRRGDLLRARQYVALAEKAPVPPKDPDAVFRLALVISVRGGQYDDAIVRCRRRLENKEETAVRLLLALLLEAEGKTGEAEMERKLVLAAHPEDTHQLIEMARFYQRSGRPDAQEQAMKFYQQYLRSAPAGSDAPVARAALRALDMGEDHGELR